MLNRISYFCEHFAEFKDSFVLIGGSACTVWYAHHRHPFRATEDLDVVLIIEQLDDRFEEAFFDFIRESNYQIRERIPIDSGGVAKRILYRFSQPESDLVPEQIELLSRKPSTIQLRDDQRIVPVKRGDVGEYTGLSCILLDDQYYHLVTEHIYKGDQIPRVSLGALILLKIKAYLNLNESYRSGEEHGSDQSLHNARKHRNDVFFILMDVDSGSDGFEVPLSVREDIRRFIQMMRETPSEWGGVVDHLRRMRGKLEVRSLTLEDFIDILQGMFLVRS